jgi:hypothetical protein
MQRRHFTPSGACGAPAMRAWRTARCQWARLTLVLVTCLCSGAASCQSADRRASNMTASIGLRPHASLQGFSVTPIEWWPRDEAWLGILQVEPTVGAAPEQWLARWRPPEDLEMLRTWPFDTASARISGPMGDRFVVSTGTPASDGVFAFVELEVVHSSDARTLAAFDLKQAILNLPARRALHLDDQEVVWALGVDEEFVLRLFRIQPDGAVRTIPLVRRLTIDLNSQLGGWSGGVTLLASARQSDIVALPDGGLGIEGDESSAVLFNFDRAGVMVDSRPIPTALSATAKSLVVQGDRVLAAGQVVRGLNDTSGFLSTWRVGAGGLFEQLASRTFDLPDASPIELNDVAWLPDDRVLVTGEVGLQQVETGSVVRGSRMFVAEFESDLTGPRAVAYLGDGERRNAGNQILRSGDRTWVFAHLDFPKTHDADNDASQAYSRAKLYEVLVGR